jgi:hypothetical protein
VKQCPKCLENKPIAAFDFVKKLNRLQSWCRICTNVANRASYRKMVSTDPEYNKKRNVRYLARGSASGRIGRMWSSTKNGAERRGLDHTLTKEELTTITESQNWRCAKTNIPFDLAFGKGLRPFGPAVDRIDSNLGYTADNIQVVCNLYNFAKHKFTDADVVTMAAALLKAEELVIR